MLKRNFVFFFHFFYRYLKFWRSEIMTFLICILSLTIKPVSSNNINNKILTVNKTLLDSQRIQSFLLQFKLRIKFSCPRLSSNYTTFPSTTFQEIEKKKKIDVQSIFHSKRKRQNIINFPFLRNENRWTATNSSLVSYSSLKSCFHLHFLWNLKMKDKDIRSSSR